MINKSDAELDKSKNIRVGLYKKRVLTCKMNIDLKNELRNDRFAAYETLRLVLTECFASSSRPVSIGLSAARMRIVKLVVRGGYKAQAWTYHSACISVGLLLYHVPINKKPSCC